MTRYEILHGPVFDVLRGFKSNSLDAAFCDPPYGFRFMAKKWDYDVPSVETWAEVLRVLKPGAPLLAFGGARTYHRLACGIEDAGFELRDCLMWLYGKGFPKSQNIGLAIDKAAGATRAVMGVNPSARPSDGRSENLATAGTTMHASHVTAPATDLAKEWDGWGTALKPAFEPIALARKSLDGTMAENVARWGVGGLDIDGYRIGEGRWPANLILDEDAGALLDATVGNRPSRPSVTRNGGGGGMTPLADLKGTPRPDSGYSDSGGPSRFFYCAKVSTREREAGCEALPKRTAGEVTGGREEDSTGLDSPRTGAGRTGGARNHHPTLKPIALTTYLAKLIKPPVPGAILVPFSGAGSEMIGTLLAGWPFVIGIEQDAEYIEIAQARLTHWLAKEGT